MPRIHFIRFDLINVCKPIGRCCARVEKIETNIVKLMSSSEYTINLNVYLTVVIDW